MSPRGTRDINSGLETVSLGGRVGEYKLGERWIPRFLSLRQPVHDQHSPVVYDSAQIPNSCVPSSVKLRTTCAGVIAEVVSLCLVVSKPPDCANLVRIS